MSQRWCHYCWLKDKGPEANTRGYSTTPAPVSEEAGCRSHNQKELSLATTQVSLKQIRPRACRHEWSPVQRHLGLACETEKRASHTVPCLGSTELRGHTYILEAAQDVATCRAARGGRRGDHAPVSGLTTVLERTPWQAWQGLHFRGKHLHHQQLQTPATSWEFRNCV